MNFSVMYIHIPMSFNITIFACLHQVKNILPEFVTDTKHFGSSVDYLTLLLVKIQTFWFMINWPTSFPGPFYAIQGTTLKNLRNLRTAI